jgi:hypothetical protein
MFFSYRVWNFRAKPHAELRIGRTGLAGYYEKRATVPVVNWRRSAMAVVPSGRWGRARI